MKKKLREQIKALAKQIFDDEKMFKTASAKELVAKLYEKLVVLEYLEKQLEDVPNDEMEESLDSKSFREENWFTEPEPVPQPDHREDIIEPLMEKIKDIVAQMPEEGQRIDELLDEMLPQNNEDTSVENTNFEETEDTFLIETETFIEETLIEETSVEEMQEENLSMKETGFVETSAEKTSIQESSREEPAEERVEEEEKPTSKYIKNELEEFASNYQRMPEFERKQTQLFPESLEVKAAKKTLTESRVRSVNDSVNKGLNIGLNDRLIFIKHLFEGQAEDYTRVLSQINTMGNYEEAQNFIKEKVKPDYNNWVDKEVYSERFMHIIEKRFN